MPSNVSSNLKMSWDRPPDDKIIGNELPEDAINPAHEFIPKVNSPSPQIFYIFCLVWGRKCKDQFLSTNHFFGLTIYYFLAEGGSGMIGITFTSERIPEENKKKAFPLVKAISFFIMYNQLSEHIQISLDDIIDIQKINRILHIEASM